MYQRGPSSKIQKIFPEEHAVNVTILADMVILNPFFRLSTGETCQYGSY